MELIAFLSLGLIAGFFAGLLGLGGGIITVPVMTLIALPYFNVPENDVMHVAIASSLAAMIPTAIMSTYGHHRQQGINWSIAIKFTPGLILGSIIGALLAGVLFRQGLQIIFAVFLAVVAIRMLFDRVAFIKPSLNRPGGHTLAATLISAVSALLGVGGGTMTVPYLMWRGIVLPKAIAISAYCGVPIAIVSTITYFVTQNLLTYNAGQQFIYLPAVIGVGFGSMFSAPIGAKFTQLLPVYIIKYLFSLVLLFVSVKLFLAL